MNGDIREPEPADDDIPVLTDIVVPGRLQPDAATLDDAPQAPAEFSFDAVFQSVDAPGASGYGSASRSAEPIAGDDIELPLPWTDTAPASTPPDTRTNRDEPLIVAAAAKAAAMAVEPPDADAQLLLRGLLAEIGKGLERRLAQEMALTEQRLRAALNEELDTRLRELLAGTPPLR